MGRDRSIINEEFKDQEEIDTNKDEKHKPNNFSRERKDMKRKGKKFKFGLKKRL